MAHVSDDGVAVLGTGAMGSALAATLLHAKQSVTVWNRTQGRVDELVERGAARATSVAGAVAAARMVLVCLLDNDAVEQVLARAGAGLRDRVVVNVSNGTPRQARAAAGRVHSAGAAYLDGGILAVPALIGKPSATILYSGDEAAFVAHERQLAGLGTPRYLGPDAGLAALFDLALLSGMYGLFAGFLQAAGLMHSEQRSMTELMPLLEPWLNTMLPSLTKAAGQMQSGDYATGVTSPLSMQARAVHNIIDASREQEVRGELFAGLQALVDAAVAAGHGAHDMASIVEVMRRSGAEAR